MVHRRVRRRRGGVGALGASERPRRPQATLMAVGPRRSVEGPERWRQFCRAFVLNIVTHRLHVVRTLHVG